jgi:hypothetical protein
MTALTTILTPSRIKTAAFDIIALAIIYFVPALSHMLAVPVYFVEPMRIMVILAIAHTHRNNAYLLALTIPVFSFLVSAHPSFLKSVLIGIELMANVWLFFMLSKIIRNSFAAMVSAIIGSKILYYIMKFSLISTAVMGGKLVSIPLEIQLATSVVFSLYILLIFRKQNRKEG